MCVYVCVVAGLLLCYELPVQTDRDGKPIDRFLISRSRSYQQTLTALIHEVCVRTVLLLPLTLLFVLTELLLVFFYHVGEHSALRVAPSSPPATGLARFHESSFPCCPTGLCL